MAFIDESYYFDPKKSDDTSYVLAAVIIDGDDISEARQRTRLAAEPATDFHKTDLWHNNEVATIHRMLRHIHDDAGWNVFAIQAPFGGHADKARQQCLEQLLIELDGRKVGAVVCDSRIQPNSTDPQQLNREDLNTARKLRSSQRVSRQLQVRHASDAQEPLLWLPDGVAWATRRALVLDDGEHYELIRPVTTLIVVTDPVGK